MKFLAYYIVAFIVISLAYGTAVYCALSLKDASSLSVPATAILMIFGFPFMDFGMALGGDQLTKYLGDFGTLILFAVLDITCWAWLVAWLATRRFGRKGLA